jgi:hypothetical protein
MEEDDWSSGSSEFTWFGTVLFFLSVLMAFVIIGFSAYLVETSFGIGSMMFGFIMLAASVLLKVTKRW